jgi:hypothetical protein
MRAETFWFSGSVRARRGAADGFPDRRDFESERRQAIMGATILGFVSPQASNSAKRIAGLRSQFRWTGKTESAKRQAILASR